MALFCRRVGSNLQEVVGELEKLFTYLGERNLVDVADVAAIVADSRVDSIFELTNALGGGDAGEALRLLGRLLGDGQAPLLVLNLMVRHFRQLWLTRELLDQGGGKGRWRARSASTPTSSTVWCARRSGFRSPASARPSSSFSRPTWHSSRAAPIPRHCWNG